MMAATQCISIQQTFNEYFPYYKSTLHSTVSWNSFCNHYWLANELLHSEVTFTDILLTSPWFFTFWVIFPLIFTASLGPGQNFPDLISCLPICFLSRQSSWLRQIYSGALYGSPFYGSPCFLNLVPFLRRWIDNWQPHICISRLDSPEPMHSIHVKCMTSPTFSKELLIFLP